jgi:hypothetical protein
MDVELEDDVQGDELLEVILSDSITILNSSFVGVEVLQ